MRAATLLVLFTAAVVGFSAGPAARGQPPASPAGGPEVRSTILRGSGPPAPLAPTPPSVRAGDVSLNFPGVDIEAAAKAILGDVLHVRYAVDPSVHGAVSVVTPAPIARADVLAFFEDALKSANLALAERAGVYTIVPLATARGESGLLGASDMGFGSEAIALRYVSAAELKALLDPIVPGVIVSADPARNVMVIAGTTGQRRAIRDLAAQFDVDWLRGMSFALFVPQRTDARLIAPELDKLLNGPGARTAGLVRLIPMEKLNGILAISSQPDLLEDTRRFVEILDREGEGAERRIFVYHVQNGRASDLAKVLDNAFGITPSRSQDEANPGINEPYGAAPTIIAPPAPPAPNPVITRALPMVSPSPGPANPAPGASDQEAAQAPITITADDTNNALVVFSTPRQYAVIEDALRRLDVLPLQVMIDATITEVTLNHNLRYGIQWSFQDSHNLAALNTQGTTSVPQQIFPGFSYLYQGGNIRATLNALAQVTDVNVLSAPKLVVLNNHTAQIEVGDEVPIATGSAVSTLGGGAPIVNTIEYRDTGVILKVTPRVNANGLVLLDISQEVSDVSTTGSSTIDSPTIQQRKISTSIAVQDGSTVALGGLIRNEVTKTRSTIPLLGQIPIIGHLFGDTGKALARTELLVILTPRVIRTSVDAEAATQELREKIQLAAPPPKPWKSPKR
ncbi:MAG: type II secretion system secretin GspD [Caulobacteraceae bacterium]